MFFSKKLRLASAVLGVAMLSTVFAGCGGDKKAEHKEVVKFGVTNFADSLETSDNYFGWIVEG